MYFKLEPKKLEKLLNYLKDRPWVEVAQLIVELTNLEKINEKTDTDSTPAPVSSSTLAGTVLYSKTRKAPNGLRMCLKKNDKPKLSFKTGKWHLDRECCLDNREIPNSRCYYGPKYQKLLNKFHLKFDK